MHVDNDPTIDKWMATYDFDSDKDIDIKKLSLLLFQLPRVALHQATIIVAKGKSYDGKNACLVATTALGKGDQSEGQKPIFQIEEWLYPMWCSVLMQLMVFTVWLLCHQKCVVDKYASDKVLQHNGGGSHHPRLPSRQYCKLYRSCGNCKTQYKISPLNNVKLTNVKVAVVGINSNYGDTATIKGLTL
uniref:Probable pectate lyase F n=1 Tax=Ditylenchus dipsaci TaxID=166011 RepID=A0A915E5K9_9BILA